VFTAETVDGRVIAMGNSLTDTHDEAIVAFRMDRSIREAFVIEPDGMTWIMARPRIMNLSFDRENIRMHKEAMERQ
jgi:hypothetical protein